MVADAPPTTLKARSFSQLAPITLRDYRHRYKYASEGLPAVAVEPWMYLGPPRREGRVLWAHLRQLI